MFVVSIGAVGGIELSGLLFPAIFHDTAGFEEVSHPIVVRFVLFNGSVDTEGQFQMEIGSNSNLTGACGGRIGIRLTEGRRKTFSRVMLL